MWNADRKVTLKYCVDTAEGLDSSGIMELTVPAALLKPGEAAELRVVGSAAKSRRWFGRYETDLQNPL